MASVTPVVVLPQYYARTSVEPLEDTVWLVPKRTGQALIPVCVSLGIVLLLVSVASQSVLGVVVTCLGCALGALIGTGLRQARTRMQVCPECLIGMGRGAHRCVACGFRPGNHACQ